LDVVEQTIQTYDDIASEYCKKTRNPKFLEWEEKYIKRLLYYISKSIPTILDVGCGDGRHTFIIDKNGGKAISVDLSKSMLDEAIKLYPEGDFRKMDMRALSFEDDSFEGIWVSGSIYHVPKSQIGDVIKEFRRVIKEHGVIAVNYKLGSGEGMETSPRSYSEAPRFFAYYDEKEMQDLFGGFGFDLLESLSYPEEVFGDKIKQVWFELKQK
jgi:ubiquinone/menaquinone biosynthesis C-methylase UbiE